MKINLLLFTVIGMYFMVDMSSGEDLKCYKPLLTKALLVKKGMTEKELLDVVGKFEFSGIVGSHAIHIPSFFNEGKPSLQMVIFFGENDGSDVSVVLDVGDTVIILDEGKSHQYSLIELREMNKDIQNSGKSEKR